MYEGGNGTDSLDKIPQLLSNSYHPAQRICRECVPVCKSKRMSCQFIGGTVVGRCRPHAGFQCRSRALVRPCRSFEECNEFLHIALTLSGLCGNGVGRRSHALRVMAGCQSAWLLVGTIHNHRSQTFGVGNPSYFALQTAHQACRHFCGFREYSKTFGCAASVHKKKSTTGE